jgi:hypothetical protein
MSRIAQLALAALQSPQAPATACCLPPVGSTGTRIQDPALLSASTPRAPRFLPGHSGEALKGSHEAPTP